MIKLVVEGPMNEEPEWPDDAPEEANLILLIEDGYVSVEGYRGFHPSLIDYLHEGDGFRDLIRETMYPGALDDTEHTLLVYYKAELLSDTVIEDYGSWEEPYLGGEVLEVRDIANEGQDQGQVG